MKPEKIRVKLVSEAAEYVSVTHVVQRDFTLHELVEVMLPVLGADTSRIQQMIRVGTVSTGEYRYRWEGLEIAAEELETILEAVPHAEPSRPFDPERCFLVRFRHGLETLDLPRESASRKALFARQSCWDALLGLAAGVRYADYSHADKADRFTLALDPEGWQQLRALLPLLKPASAASRLERLHPEAIDWLTRR
ncbi:MAG: hypothetical protein HY651_12755 [Acidobacteria bacterium]|nr:hypothetical protein [Acidobacteriota bacterium]